MESVVASVSGYHGMERFKLIKLINQTGANYVGTMTRSTTHLVCRKFEGRKYELAKSLGTTIVSHRWFEDCAKEGKRLPENPYILQSGAEVGPLLWDVPLGKRNSSSTGKNGKALCDQSNIHNASVQRPPDVDCTDVVEVAWNDSHLLKENTFPHSMVANKGSCKSKRRKTHKTLKQEYSLKANKCSLDLLASGVVRVQNEESASPSTMPYGSGKRNVRSAAAGTSSAGPTSKGRRLVKKDSVGDILDSSLFKCEQEPFSTEASCQQINTDAASDHINTMRHDINQVAINVASDDSSDLRNENDQVAIQGSGFRYSHENNDEGLEGIEDVLELNSQHPSDNLLVEGVIPTHERTVENDFCDFEEQVGGALGLPGDLRELADLPTSTELSCVICWTDFSSTRGVLPCGHRFCYSCIQGWADHMASSRKGATCPLCKGIFKSIMKVDCAASSDQKIYSQSIPYSSAATDIFILPDQENSSFRGQSSVMMVCSECRCREPEDLLISCHLCQSKWVHSYCLDPPLDPWACLHCRDLRSLYNYIR